MSENKYVKQVNRVSAVTRLAAALIRAVLVFGILAAAILSAGILASAGLLRVPAAGPAPIPGTVV